MIGHDACIARDPDGGVRTVVADQLTTHAARRDDSILPRGFDLHRHHRFDLQRRARIEPRARGAHRDAFRADRAAPAGAFEMHAREDAAIRRTQRCGHFVPTVNPHASPAVPEPASADAHPPPTFPAAA